uniref:Uncharacterized protein n=1 Tax=Glypta fumiferanae TaxID=389681 RepID=A0A0F6QAA0_9HYME|nr:hypothetical protein [Glypta fumiferanae]
MTTNSSVLDSPLRRSTRIKPPVVVDVSSPESNGDASSTGTTRTTRRRTVAADSTITEPPRTLRVRRNSAVSDISEITEPESDSGAKRITRRSIAGATFVETPTKLRARPR